MRKIRFGCLSILLLLVAFSVEAKAPKEFKFIYYGTAGQVSQGTEETITVQKKEVLVKRNAKELGDGAGKRVTEFTYPVTEAQLEALVQLVRGSGFMTWPKSPEAPHQSQADEFIEIHLDGKSVKRTKWEEGNQEKFRILYNRFNDWLTSVRSIRF